MPRNSLHVPSGKILEYTESWDTKSGFGKASMPLCWGAKNGISKQSIEVDQNSGSQKGDLAPQGHLIRYGDNWLSPGGGGGWQR